MELKKGYKQNYLWIKKNLGLSAILKARIGWQGLTTTEYLTEGNYYLITGTDFKNGFIDWDNCVYVEKKRYTQDKNIQIKHEDILVTKDGTIGKIAFIHNIPKPSTLNSGIFVIRPKKNAFVPKYLYHILRSNHFKEFLNRLTAGSTISHLYQKDFVNYNFICPANLEEQNAIATVLSDTDELIQTLQKKIAKKRLIKQGAMQKLLTPKEGWVERRLGDICDIKMGQSPNSLFYNIKGIGLPLIQGNADIKNRKTIIRNYTTHITKRCIKGNIIMSIRAPVGEIAIASHDSCIGRGVCALSYPNFYLYYFLISIESKWAEYSTGSTFDSVNSDIIRRLPLTMPESISEQTQIATILADMDEEIEQLEQQLEKYQQLKQGLMQELLTGRIRLV